VLHCHVTMKTINLSHVIRVHCDDVTYVACAGMKVTPFVIVVSSYGLCGKYA
jgi:hypothetical protein